jgi:hypothetical protein
VELSVLIVEYPILPKEVEPKASKSPAGIEAVEAGVNPTQSYESLPRPFVLKLATYEKTAADILALDPSPEESTLYPDLLIVEN